MYHFTCMYNNTRLSEMIFVADIYLQEGDFAILAMFQNRILALHKNKLQMWNSASITNARGLSKKVDERRGQGGPALCLRICGGCESTRGAQI